jgi:large subunit ribosomal protein L4
MDTMLFNNKGQAQGKIDLPAYFEAEISPALLHEAATVYLNNQRAGTHSSKSRGEVAFSGAKPWKQKGTGNARAGQRNSPLWRKGGVIFGPKPRDYYVKLSKQKKQKALNMAFAVQAQNGNVIVMDSVSIDEPKTKKVAEIIKNLELCGKKVVFAIAGDANFKLASRNIEKVSVVELANINAYQVLWADKIILTPDGLEALAKRIA